MKANRIQVPTEPFIPKDHLKNPGDYMGPVQRSHGGTGPPVIFFIPPVEGATNVVRVQSPPNTFTEDADGLTAMDSLWAYNTPGRMDSGVLWHGKLTNGEWITL